MFTLQDAVWYDFLCISRLLIEFIKLDMWLGGRSPGGISFHIEMDLQTPYLVRLSFTSVSF
jgi:hypothetical protein